MPFESKIVWKNEINTLKELSAHGLPMTAIAEKYGVSKQRIKQIFQKYQIPQVGLKKKALDKAKDWEKKWGDKQDTDLYHAQRDKFRGKKANATRAGKVFTIQFGELSWPKFCPILGIELDYFVEAVAADNSPSFDQIDPGKGYVAGNVQIVSWRANRLKNDGTAEELRRIADYLDALKQTP